MHVLEAALIANLCRQRHHRREPDEPMPQQWPRPRRSRATTAALATISAIGIIVIMLGIAVAGPTRIVATAGVAATQGWGQSAPIQTGA